MTYDAFETSIQNGAPVELYALTYDTTVYRYTSADTDIVHGSETWASYPIRRAAIEATQEQARLALDIECGPDLPVLDLFRICPPDGVVAVTVLRLHRGDGNAVTLWMGRVLSVSLDLGTAKLHCESVYSSLLRPGLRRLYQKQCPHVLYSSACGLDRSAWAETCSVVSLDGVNLEVLGLPSGTEDHSYDGGYVEWTDGSCHVERRSIRTQVGSELILTFQMPGLASASPIDAESLLVYLGCDHSLATCDAEFANSDNYGGMPYIPSKNPFDGTPVY
jgi:uncharacterized phage protein (TIGR02218 family)